MRPKVAGGQKQPLAAIVQLGERQAEDLKVPGSILGLGMELLFRAQSFLFYIYIYIYIFKGS